jgi:hypothetical protein
LPQIPIRTYARAVIAVVGLAACGGASTSAPNTTASSIDFDANPDPDKLLQEEFASSFTRVLQERGLTITADQAKCMADGFLHEFGIVEINQIRSAYVAGKPDDPAVLDRGTRAIGGCLPADVLARLAKHND